MAYKRKRVMPTKKKTFKKRKTTGKKMVAAVKKAFIKLAEPKQTRIKWNYAELFHNVWNTGGWFLLNQAPIMPP